MSAGADFQTFREYSPARGLIFARNEHITDCIRAALTAVSLPYNIYLLLRNGVSRKLYNEHDPKLDSIPSFHR